MDRIAIAGAGPSGLICAALLRERGHEVRVFEASERVGGLARSFQWHGFSCDIAPHRLFTHDREVLEYLLRLVPMKHHRRRSRIFIAGRRLRDPLNPLDMIIRLPPRLAARLVLGYLRRPRLPETSFENLALNRFGRGLYDLFVGPYTRKMFGLSPAKISVEWGRQKLRVSGLRDLIRRDTKVLFQQFHYPKVGGYGAISQALYEKVADHVVFNAPMIGLETRNGSVRSLRYRHNQREHSFSCDRLISTIPATVLGRLLGHEFSLRFQPVTLVYLLLDKPQAMPYHWVYFGDGDVVINRLAEFKNFSEDGVPKDRTVLVAEITTPTDEPVRDALASLERYGLVRTHEVLDSLQIHERFGYPVYDRHFEQAVEEATQVFGKFDNLHLVGRNAEFRHIDLDETFTSARRLVRSLSGEDARAGELAGALSP